MDAQPPIETVYEALNALYMSADATNREKSNQWLQDLQKSVYAWKVADELLQRNADLNSSYFGAQMFRNKIVYFFHELPTDVYDSLRDMFLRHLQNADENTNSIVVTQLCLAMVDLALQMRSWKSPATDFVSQCDRFSSSVLIELLTYFPEEVDRKSMRLGANRRNEILNEFSYCCNSVNEYLKMVISSDGNKKLSLKVVRCFTSWLPVGIASLPNILDDGIVPKMLHILRSPPDEMFQPNDIDSKLHDAISECISSLIQCYRENKQILEIKFFNSIIDLEPAYHTSVARECTEMCMNYCRIFTVLGEAFMSDMLRKPKPSTSSHFSLKALDVILTCVGHHEYEVAMMTFHFWLRLSENLYEINDDDLSEIFVPYIERLLTALCRQVQMEPDHESLLDDTDDFKSFRVKVTEVVKDVIFIIGSQRCFKQMFLSLQSEGLTWDQIEAHLFIMTAVAKNLFPDENVIVPKAVNSIFELPQSTHVAVRHTAVLLLGELSEWFDEHPDQLVTALDFIVYCLQNDQLSNAAAVSLRSICCTSKMKLKENFGPLMHIAQSLTVFNVDNEHSIELIKGVMTVMSELPSEQITSVMKEVCFLHATKIYELIESGSVPKKGTSTDPTVWLDRIAAIFRYTNPSVLNAIDNPCGPVLNEMFPVFCRILECYQTDSRLMERCCRCIRFAIRCTKKSGIFVLEPLIKQLVQLYCNHQHSCFMYLGSILVDEYGENSENWPILLEMIQAFITPTFNLLKDPKGLQHHPDIVDDLFRLSSRFMQRLPIAFIQSPSLFPLLECGLVAISLDHKDANASVMKFFHEMLNFTNVNEDIQKQETRKHIVGRVIEKHGETLVNNMIHASVFSLPSYMLAEIAEVLFDLLRLNRQITYKWIKSAVDQLPKHNSASTAVAATDEQIEKFLNSCERCEMLKDLRSALKEFAYFYR